MHFESVRKYIKKDVNASWPPASNLELDKKALILPGAVTRTCVVRMDFNFLSRFV